jgi:hypothetical protein
MTTLSNILMAIAIALTLGSAHLLDGPSDTAAAQDSAASAADAAKQARNKAREQERFAQAAARICGENASWRELADGSIQCATKRGHPTLRVAATQAQGAAQ